MLTTYLSHLHSEASVSYTPPIVPTPRNHEQPATHFHNTHRPRIFPEQVPVSRIQRSGVLSIPPYTPGAVQYTSGFFQNQESTPIPRLRPALWGLPPQADEENSHLTGSRPPADFQGDSSGEEECLPSGRRTLPPLIIPHGSWHLDIHTTSNNSYISSHEPTPDSGDVSATNYLATTSFLTNLR